MNLNHRPIGFKRILDGLTVQGDGGIGTIDYGESGKVIQMDIEWRGMTRDNRDLCAWKVATGVYWIQTRSPLHARRLLKREDGRLVACGVVGGFLRTFEFNHGLKWAMRLINRYQTKSETSPNKRFLTPSASLGGRNVMD